MNIIKKVLIECLPDKTRERLIIFKNRIMCLWAHIKFCINGLSRKRTTDFYNIPIIINNFNRLGFLQRLIKSLEIRGYKNIYIIDNCSTYPPLLEYYNTCPYTVFRLNINVGYKSIWETGIYEMFKKDYYVYTDSDMEIDASCPNDFMEHFVKILEQYKTAQKVGFGIRIDDLPDSYVNKDKVIQWEGQFWEKEIQSNIYLASIDTTFALYRPYCKGEVNPFQKVFRTGTPYLIKHLPWYNLEDYRAEEDYYLSTIKTSTHWSAVNKDEYYNSTLNDNEIK